MDELYCDDITQVTDEGNEILVPMFMEEEIRRPIFQMNHNSTPGPDRFPPEFYQVF